MLVCIQIESIDSKEINLTIKYINYERPRN